MTVTCSFMVKIRTILPYAMLGRIILLCIEQRGLMSAVIVLQFSRTIQHKG